MVWKYVKQLSSEKNIESFERLSSFTFPESFKDCIRQHNGGRPKYYVFDTNRKAGRALKTFLSFNQEDKENIRSVYECCKIELQNKYIPFAIDNFGNLICFNYSNQIIFVNHETFNEEFVASSFDDFLNFLYI